MVGVGCPGGGVVVVHVERVVVQGWEASACDPCPTGGFGESTNFGGHVGDVVQGGLCGGFVEVVEDLCHLRPGRVDSLNQVSPTVGFSLRSCSPGGLGAHLVRGLAQDDPSQLHQPLYLLLVSSKDGGDERVKGYSLARVNHQPRQDEEVQAGVDSMAGKNPPEKDHQIPEKDPQVPHPFPAERMLSPLRVVRVKARPR